MKNMFKSHPAVRPDDKRRFHTEEHKRKLVESRKRNPDYLKKAREHMDRIRALKINPTPQKPAIQRFYEGIEKKEDGCWIWKRTLTKGYGSFKIEGKRSPVKVHRWSYAHFRGIPIPHPSVLICHKCNNKSCVNPDHLYAGNTKTNAKDALDAGAYKRGGNHYRSKIKEEDIEKILELDLNGKSYEEIGRLYGVTGFAISCICKGLTWKHITSNRKRLNIRKETKKSDLTKTLEKNTVLIKKMREEGQSISEIAEHFGCHKQSIWRFLQYEKNHNIA